MITDTGDADTGDAEARARLEALFVGIDRLTPAELGRLGYRPASDEDREELLDAVDAAAERTGRTALVHEARGLARDALLRRYAEGTLNTTWVALNWGVSQGTVQDRVAIAETLADAAAAIVVADVLDPEVADALALDAQAIVGLSTGAASDGALGRVLEVPADPELGPSRRMRLFRIALIAGVVLILTLTSAPYWLVAGLIVVVALLMALRRAAVAR